MKRAPISAHQRFVAEEAARLASYSADTRGEIVERLLAGTSSRVIDAGDLEVVPIAGDVHGCAMCSATLDAGGARFLARVTGEATAELVAFCSDCTAEAGGKTSAATSAAAITRAGRRAERRVA